MINAANNFDRLALRDKREHGLLNKRPYMSHLRGQN